MEGDGTPLPNLLCTEDISSFNQTSIGRKDDFISVSRSESDFVEMSFGKETAFRPDQNQLQPLPKTARVEAVKWILHTMALFGYHYRTAYLALIYFDQFVAKSSVSNGKPTWTGRILSIACLSIAAKMEESKVRSFGEYPANDGYDFRGIVVQRMELCVLNTLGWKMAVVTPFTYLNYFVTKFCVDVKSRHQQIVTQAAEFVLGILEEINAADNRPSIVAAASVLAAYDHYLDREMLENKMDAISSWGSLEKEQTFSCYCLLLQEILMVKTPKAAFTLSSAHASSVTSRGGSKRRLNFHDQYCPVKRNP